MTFAKIFRAVQYLIFYFSPFQLKFASRLTEKSDFMRGLGLIFIFQNSTAGVSIITYSPEPEY